MVNESELRVIHYTLGPLKPWDWWTSWLLKPVDVWQVLPSILFSEYNMSFFLKKKKLFSFFSSEGWVQGVSGGGGGCFFIFFSFGQNIASISVCNCTYCS